MPNDRDEVQAALASIRRREMKETVKEAIKEWLNEQAATFGKWSLRFALALLLSALLYGAMVNAGWTPPGIPERAHR